MYTAFFLFFFLLFNDVDIPQVALLRAFSALAQKDKGQINDKINVYGYNACPGCLCLFLSFFLLQKIPVLELLYQLICHKHFYVNKHNLTMCTI